MLVSILFTLAVFGYGSAAEAEPTVEISKWAGVMFNANCTATEFTPWMGEGKCLWYRGSTANSMKAIMTMAKEVGCKVPSPTMLKAWMKKLTEASIWKNAPMMQNLPEDGMCGKCGRKIRCCAKEESFMVQSYNSETCGEVTTPCHVKPMTTADFEWIRSAQPQMPLNEDNCDYDQLMGWSMKKMQTNKFWSVVKPLMCQMLGTPRPMMKCQMDTSKNMCMCCCAGWIPSNGVCIKMDMSTEMKC